MPKIHSRFELKIYSCVTIKTLEETYFYFSLSQTSQKGVALNIDNLTQQSRFLQINFKEHAIRNYEDIFKLIFRIHITN
jgi:hypothetical protein